MDTTVQEKAIAHPTDARLYDTASQKLVGLAGIVLRHSYARKGSEALRMHGRYCHAKQFRRARKRRKMLRNYLGGCSETSSVGEPVRPLWMTTAKRFWTRSASCTISSRKTRKAIRALHAPEVWCISKGKARKRYEFGCKVGVVTSLKNNWVLSLWAFSENVYDGQRGV